MTKMIGVILSAGMAKRLRPLTDTKPKCLLTVGGKTLLQRTIDAMMQAGISEFVVVTGYRADMIRNFIDETYSSSAAVFHFLHNADYEHNNNIPVRPGTGGPHCIGEWLRPGREPSRTGRGRDEGGGRCR